MARRSTGASEPEVRPGKQDQEGAGETEARRRGIQSVEIGLRVLEALNRLGGASTLTMISQASGMVPPQTHRYLSSLIAAGMAQQDPQTGRYDLGPAALRLGLGALARIDAFAITDQAIGAFAARSGRTVQVAALGPLGPTIVRWKVGRPPVMTSFNVGSVLPLLHSATGHAFLAFAPEGETDHLVERELAETGLTSADVEAIRRRVRGQGFAHVEGTMVPGLRATAFPILDLQGRAILTATAIVPGSWPDSGDDVLRIELGRVCAEISAKLGASI